MKRRSLIGQAGTLGLFLLAGCTSNPDRDRSDGDGSDDPVRFVDSAFEVRHIGAGTQADDATLEFDEASQTIRVDGTIWGADGCTTASLDAVEFAAGNDTVTVAVATRDRAGTDDRACTQAIVEIDYTAVLTFEGGLPATATVTHDGRSVTTAGP